MAARSSGTSFSTTFAVTTGAGPPSPPRPRPPRPPLPGPAADVLPLQAAATREAITHRWKPKAGRCPKIAEQRNADRHRGRCRNTKVVSTEVQEDTGPAGALFTGKSSFDVSLRSHYPRLDDARSVRRRAARGGKARAGGRHISATFALRDRAGRDSAVRPGDPRPRQERELRSAARPTRPHDARGRGRGAAARSAADDEERAHAVRCADAAAARSHEGGRRVSVAVAAGRHRFSGGHDVARLHRSGEPRRDVGTVSAGADVPAAGRRDESARALAAARARADQRTKVSVGPLP